MDSERESSRALESTSGQESSFEYGQLYERLSTEESDATFQGIMDDDDDDDDDYQDAEDGEENDEEDGEEDDEDDEDG
jgi:hypothetical protein